MLAKLLVACALVLSTVAAPAKAEDPIETPPQAVDDTYSIDIDVTSQVELEVLQNDVPADTSTLSKWVPYWTESSEGSGVSVTTSSTQDRIVIDVAPTAEPGVVTFTYAASWRGRYKWGELATVTLNLFRAPRPVAAHDAYTGLLRGRDTFTIDPTINDVDPEGRPLSVASCTRPASVTSPEYPLGQVSISGSVVTVEMQASLSASYKPELYKGFDGILSCTVTNGTYASLKPSDIRFRVSYFQHFVARRVKTRGKFQVFNPNPVVGYMKTFISGRDEQGNPGIDYSKRVWEIPPRKWTTIASGHKRPDVREIVGYVHGVYYKGRKHGMGDGYVRVRPPKWS